MPESPDSQQPLFTCLFEHSCGAVAYPTQDDVPLWRDGVAGQNLQKCMVEVAARRLFDYGVLEQHGKAAYASGFAWASFTRICGPPNFHVDTVMERLFDTRDRWTDSAKALNRLAFDGHLS